MTEPLRISVEIARSFVDEYINEAYEEPVAAAIDARVRPLVEALLELREHLEGKDALRCIDAALKDAGVV